MTTRQTPSLIERLLTRQCTATATPTPVDATVPDPTTARSASAERAVPDPTVPDRNAGAARKSAAATERAPTERPTAESPSLYPTDTGLAAAKPPVPDLPVSNRDPVDPSDEDLAVPDRTVPEPPVVDMTVPVPTTQDQIPVVLTAPEPTTTNPIDQEEAISDLPTPQPAASVPTASVTAPPSEVASEPASSEPASSEPASSEQDTSEQDTSERDGASERGASERANAFGGATTKTPARSKPSGSVPADFEAGGVEPGGVEPGGVEPGGVQPDGVEIAGVEAGGSDPSVATVSGFGPDTEIGEERAGPELLDFRSDRSDVAVSQRISPTASSHPIPPKITETDPACAKPAAGDPNAPAQPSTSDQHKPDPLSARPRTSSAGDNVDKYRLARAYLMRVAEPPATALLAFVDSVGPLEAAAAVRAADVPDRVLAETSARRHLELAESDLADAKRVGARLVVPEDEEWPAWPLLSLAAASDRGQQWAGSALGLWARGPASLADTFEQAVSVVGARSASGYGEYVAAEIGNSLARAGMSVVSGAAYGIDGSAHRGALAADGVTVAVLGCGVDICYPAGHTNLIEEIAAKGLVLSEYPPGTRPARHRFLVRNRLIAALSSGTVVVEAGIRSGARNTATTAAALGKVVLAVPGPITSATSAGCHDLLRTGTAMLAGSVSEILEAVGPVGENLAEPPVGPTRRTDGLVGEALRVHEALRRRVGRTPARIAVESGVPIHRVRALLPELELTDLAERCEDGWRQAPAP